MLNDPVIDVVLVAVGVIAIVVAIVWRAGSRRGQIDRLARLLASTDPQRRADAATAITALGLDRSARPLLARARVEPDPAVRIAIADAVARRQWEPAGPPGVTELREWAATELAAQGYNVSTFGPATTRLADMGGPRLPQPLQHPPSSSGSASSAAPALPTDTAAGNAG